MAIFFTVAIVTFAFFFYNKSRTNNNVENNNLVNDNIETSDSTSVQPQVKLADVPDEPLVIPEWYKTDKDGDGMSDEEEDLLGTDKWESDSDGDGLSDKLEIEKYKTDPIKDDTDGDGYRDGVEILNGYDPLKP